METLEDYCLLEGSPPPHWSYVLLSGLFIGACFNWSALKKLGVKIPNIWLQDTMEFFRY